MSQRSVFTRFVASICLALSLTCSALAQTDASPSEVANLYLETAQRLAKIWVETKPWPSRYTEYLDTAKQEFAPLLSQAALKELESKSPTGPKELTTPDNDPEGGDDAIYEGMIACVAKAHFTVLSEDVQGNQAKVDVETTVSNAFGSGKTESFQDQLVLVKENGRWVLTPEAFRTFAF